MAGTRVQEGEDDGMLTALEILGFDLDGVELTFLSACETARGIDQAGEGVLGLVRAFTVAGSKHVAPRHWAAFGMYGPLR